MREIYIHWGSNHFEPDKIHHKTLSPLQKPDMGLWASRENAELRWDRWCQQNQFHTELLGEYFRFLLCDDAKILQVRSYADIAPYVIKNDRMFFENDAVAITDRLNRDALYEAYGGIELFLSDNISMHRGFFNTWDCDSICIWDPYAIQEI